MIFNTEFGDISPELGVGNGGEGGAAPPPWLGTESGKNGEEKERVRKIFKQVQLSAGLDIPALIFWGAVFHLRSVVYQWTVL